jgi:hypothetical protein
LPPYESKTPMMIRRWVIAMAFLLIVAAGGLFAYAHSQKPLLELGVGYAARVGCGCRYIGNRPMSDCEKDFEPGMEPISLHENPATKTVTASVPFIASRSATYDPVLGCQPEPLKR